MKIGSVLWQSVTSPAFKMFEFIGCCIHRHNVQRSLKRSIIIGDGRDAIRYYENGRSVRVEAELMHGPGLGRLVYRNCPLKWDQTQVALTLQEKENVFHEVCKYFDGKGIKWQFSDADAKHWK